MIDISAKQHGNARIIVIGVGGGGCNAVDRMIEDNVEFIDFVAVNTDHQVLESSKAPIRIQIGEKLTRGLGAGGDPAVGMRAAEETEEEIAKTISGSDMVFITAGMGGGTGTGAAPVVARVAKSLNVLTVGVVTKPFAFEGKKRMKNATEGIDELKKHVDTLIVIPNQKLLNIVERDTSLKDSFKKADEILRQGVEGIASIILKPGVINLDFADVKTTMINKGVAHMGVGRASGKNKAEDAARMAINSPLLETTMEGAKNVLISISGDDSLSLLDTEMAADIINSDTDDDAEIILGTSINPDLNDEVIITVIATGLDYEDMTGMSSLPDFTAVSHGAHAQGAPPAQTQREVPQDTQTQPQNVQPQSEPQQPPEMIRPQQPEMRPVRDMNSDSRFVIPDFLQKKKK